MSDTNASRLTTPVLRRRLPGGLRRHARDAVLRLRRGSSPTSPSGMASTLGVAAGPVRGLARAGHRRRIARWPTSAARRSSSPRPACSCSRGRATSTFSAIDAVCTHEGCTITGADGDDLRLSVPRVALQPQRPGAGRPGQGVTASVRHHLRGWRRDDRALIRHGATQPGHRSPASPRRIRRQRRGRRDLPRHVAGAGGRASRRLRRPARRRRCAHRTARPRAGGHRRTSSRPTSTSTTRASAGCSA